VQAKSLIYIVFIALRKNEASDFLSPTRPATGALAGITVIHSHAPPGGKSGVLHIFCG